MAFQAVPLSIDQLTEQSEVVLRGKVLSKSCQRDPEGRIYTKVELQVDEVGKGTVAEKRFTVVHGGGVLGEKRVKVSGQVEYAIGEEVVVFLVLNQRGEGVTLSLAQGKFHLWKDDATGAQYACTSFHGVPESKSSPAQTQGVISQQRLTLSELKQHVDGGRR